MDDGLFQILIIAFFILISMMDATARKKRKKAGRERRAGRSPTTAEAETPGSAGKEASAEGMVPDQLWEEIATLAGGGSPPTTTRLPPARAPRGERPSTRWEASTSEHARTRVPARTPESEQATFDPERWRGETHDQMEWQPEDLRAPPRPSSVDEPRPERFIRVPDSVTDSAGGNEVRPGVEGKPLTPPGAGSMRQGVRRTLAGAGQGRMRQAVVWAEILGRPVTLRDSEHEPPG